MIVVDSSTDSMAAGLQRVEGQGSVGLIRLEESWLSKLAFSAERQASTVFRMMTSFIASHHAANTRSQSGSREAGSPQMCPLGTTNPRVRPLVLPQFREELPAQCR